MQRISRLLFIALVCALCTHNSAAKPTLRALLVGAEQSHDFPRFFLRADSATLRAAGVIDTAATPNLDEALALSPQADVLVFSGPHRHQP